MKHWFFDASINCDSFSVNHHTASTNKLLVLKCCFPFQIYYFGLGSISYLSLSLFFGCQIRSQFLTWCIWEPPLACTVFEWNWKIFSPNRLRFYGRSYELSEEACRKEQHFGGFIWEFFKLSNSIWTVVVLHCCFQSDEEQSGCSKCWFTGFLCPVLQSNSGVPARKVYFLLSKLFSFIRFRELLDYPALLKF